MQKVLEWWESLSKAELKRLTRQYPPPHEKIKKRDYQRYLYERSKFLTYEFVDRVIEVLKRKGNRLTLSQAREILSEDVDSHSYYQRASWVRFAKKNKITLGGKNIPFVRHSFTDFRDRFLRTMQQVEKRSNGRMKLEKEYLRTRTVKNADGKEIEVEDHTWWINLPQTEE